MFFWNQSRKLKSIKIKIKTILKCTSFIKRNKHLRFEANSGEVSQAVREAQEEITSKLQKQLAAKNAIVDSWMKESLEEEELDEEELDEREEKRLRKQEAKRKAQEKKLKDFKLFQELLVFKRANSDEFGSADIRGAMDPDDEGDLEEDHIMKLELLFYRTIKFQYKFILNSYHFSVTKEHL